MKKGNNRKNSNNGTVRRLDKDFYKFYLIHPPENADADHVAEQLINIKNVEEVFVTDGDYGFIVKARFFDGKEPDDAYNYIFKKLGSNFGRVTSYYQYRK